MISKITRQNIFTHLEQEDYCWSGNMSDLDFLSRLYNLEKFPSHDGRFENAAGDIRQHTVNNDDYMGYWIVDDDRFNLLECDDEDFLGFLSEMVHPLVRNNPDDARRIASIMNDWLAKDGCRLGEVSQVGERPIFKAFSSKMSSTVVIGGAEEKVLDRIWGPQHYRIFLSHKSSVKEHVSKLKQSLKECGISAFVAHNDIEPDEEWQREIESALFSMDALVALITDDYHESKWTDQEVGVAIGRGVPVIAVRLGGDPYGLIGKIQGLSGTWSKPNDMAAKIFSLIYKRTHDKSKIFECAISAYDTSKSWEDSGWRVNNILSMFESLSGAQLARVFKAYYGNDDNKHSFAGRGALIPLLDRWTGNTWKVEKDGALVQIENANSDDKDIPF